MFPPVALSDADFQKYYRLYEDDIRGVARTLARTNDDLCDDLYNIGLVTLWRIDVTTITRNERAFIRQAVRNRMTDFLRADRSKRYVSLDELLEGGDQVTYTPEGSMHLLPGNRPLTDSEVGEDTDDYGTTVCHLS